MHVERRERGYSSVPKVIAHGTLWPFWGQRQQRMETLQNLTLTLLVNAKHEGLIWRIEVA